MRICIISGKQSSDTFESTQWRKVKQVQPVWLCVLLCWRFEETFESTHRIKVKQMSTVWLCLHSGRQFDFSFENSQWRNLHKCNQCDYASSGANACERTFLSMKELWTIGQKLANVWSWSKQKVREYKFGWAGLKLLVVKRLLVIMLQ